MPPDSTVYCRNCLRPTAPSAQFCSACGSRITWVCQCGADNLGTFCHRCKSQRHIPAPFSKSQTTLHQDLLLPIIICAIVVLVIAGALSFAMFSSAPGSPSAVNLPAPPPRKMQPEAKPEQASIVQTERLGNAGSTIDEPTKEQPPRNDPEAQRLIEQRKRELHRIDLVERMLATQSFARRSELYCYLESDRPYPIIGFVSGEDLYRTYRRLLESEPSTQADGIERQRQLQSVRWVLGQYEQNVDECKNMLSTGWKRLPSEEELRQYTSQQKQLITEIDQKLSGPAPPRDSPIPQP
jgi:hypothetical protein